MKHENLETLHTTEIKYIEINISTFHSIFTHATVTAKNSIYNSVLLKLAAKTMRPLQWLGYKKCNITICTNIG